jgi:hypothetical protein
MDYMARFEKNYGMVLKVLTCELLCMVISEHCCEA